MYKEGQHLYVKSRDELIAIRGLDANGNIKEPCSWAPSMNILFGRCVTVLQVIYNNKYYFRVNGTELEYCLQQQSLRGINQEELKVPKSLEGFRNLLYLK